MGLDALHPSYLAHKEDWVTLRDFYKGERAVKGKREIYLPATQGMKLDGMDVGKPGREAYDAYLLRAVFHDFVKVAVEAYIGVMHQKPPTIELPAVMEPLRTKATVYGEPLVLLLRRINEEQLVTGRCGLLLDLPLTPDPAAPLPYIALYIAESIRNWDDGSIEEGESKLNLVVLDESGFRRDVDFQWIPVTKYRVLQLGDLLANESQGTATYSQAAFRNEGGSPSYDPSLMVTPMLRGSTLEEIPFVFVNSKDIVPDPDEPPLMGLARLAGAVYRGEADYRQGLFMQGQDTLVIVGERQVRSAEPEPDGAPLRTGAGSVIGLEVGGDAKYIGVNSSGLSEQRLAIENDTKKADAKSGQLAAESASTQESGSAKRTRIAAQTASLNQIAETGAAALEAILKACARWMGANPDEVKVTPNLEFSDFDMSGKNLVDIMTARAMGAPLSKRSIHAQMADQGMTKLDFETELEVIAEEDAQAPALGTGAGGDPPGTPASGAQ